MLKRALLSLENKFEQSIELKFCSVKTIVDNVHLESIVKKTACILQTNYKAHVKSSVAIDIQKRRNLHMVHMQPSSLSILAYCPDCPLLKIKQNCCSNLCFRD